MVFRQRPAGLQLASPDRRPRTRVFNNPKVLGKVKWQAAANTTLDAFIGYDGVFREHRGITSSMEPVASIKQAGADRSFGATLTQLLGGSAVFTPVSYTHLTLPTNREV